MKINELIKLTRISQPIGIFYLFIPCLLGIAINQKKFDYLEQLQLIKFFVYFLIGSIVMRSAGCIINDLLDKKFDKKVKRTKNRPLASKKITNFQAIIFLVLLLSIGFAILLRFNFTTILSGLIALALVITYPIMKRIFILPQLYLGFTFNFGVIMASLAVSNDISLNVCLVYLFGILWTMIYDTIYGFQDIEDDMKIGVKSTSILITKTFINPKVFLYFINIVLLLLMMLIGVINGFKLMYFIFCAFSFLFMYIDLIKCSLKKPKQCLGFFKRNISFGLIFLIAIMLG